MGIHQVLKLGLDLAQVGRLDVAVRPAPGAGPIEARRALTNALEHDNEQHCRHHTHVIDTEPNMNAIHSREYFQESAGCQHWQGFQTAAFSMLYGAPPAYTARSPSTLRCANQPSESLCSIQKRLLQLSPCKCLLELSPPTTQNHLPHVWPEGRSDHLVTYLACPTLVSTSLA